MVGRTAEEIATYRGGVANGAPVLFGGGDMSMEALAASLAVGLLVIILSPFALLAVVAWIIFREGL